jgi:hypothetical protein
MSSKRIPEYLMACLGTATVAALVRFETQPEWVATGYAALLVALLALAWRAGQEIFLYQAMVMLGFTAVRTAMYNFYDLNGASSSSLTSSVWTISLLACGIPLAFLVRKTKFRAIPSWASMFALHPEQPMFFVPVMLLAVLLFLKLSGGQVTGAWGLEGFAVFVLALWAKERSFRWTGLSLLLLSICKLVYDTFYFHNPQVRYITWIGVGIMILVVAFLYGKNREALREYL